MNQPFSQNRRVDILVDQKLQLGLLTRLGIVLLAGFLLFLILALLAPTLMVWFGLASPWLRSETNFRLEVITQLVMFPLLCSMLVLFGYGVRETFKIAGPNHRMKMIFAALADFKVPRGVAFRKSDYLQDTCEQLNDCLTALHRHLADLQRAGKRAVHAVKQVEAGESEFAPVRDQAIREVDSLLRRFQLETDRAEEQHGETRPVEPLSELKSPVGFPTQRT